MPPRPTLTKPPPKDQDDLSTPKGQARPIDKRFLLKVDGQIKTSFDSKEPAATAGAAIKKLFRSWWLRLPIPKRVSPRSSMRRRRFGLKFDLNRRMPRQCDDARPAMPVTPRQPTSADGHFWVARLQAQSKSTTEATSIEHDGR